MKLLFWKWVKPILGRVIVVAVIIAVIITALVMLLRW